MSTGTHLFVAGAIFVSLMSSSAQATRCWSSWINKNQPTDANNRTDTEIIPDRNVFPSVCKGKTTLVLCKDDKAEPFDGSPDKSTSHYNVTCDSKHGLLCRPFANYLQMNYTCPDFSMQVGCDCPSTAAPGGATRKQTTLAASGTKASGTNRKPRTTPPGGDNSGSEVRVSLVLHVVLMISMLALGV